MKRLFSMLLLSACGGSNADGPVTDEDVELMVFAAASLQESLTEAGERYREDHPNVTLVFNFDSSGTLKTQIEEGAACDLFISAGQKQMRFSWPSGMRTCPWASTPKRFSPTTAWTKPP